jgi:hypothetical protein
MPLNKLDNFIKNTEGRILYVSPSDLDSTDSITNQGNSLAQPFKTLQRAIIEAARFSYLRGNSNDEVEKTTILLMPGAHTVDNRPGFSVFKDGATAKVVSPGGTTSVASDVLNLSPDSIFDLTQEDNVLYKFNSIHGGVIVPRGTSIVGLDLRKTKIRPKYVPNPTDTAVANSAIFRITGAGYFWQFSIFDGSEQGTVYTDPSDFSVNNQSVPTFSHHKLTCFEYADGVNLYSDTGLTDLDMYYAKLSNAFNVSSTRDIDDKYPDKPDGFAKQRPEWEIVGALETDPLQIATIAAGSGGTPTAQVTVKTVLPHGLTAGTPIKISGISPSNYNISTKVQSIDATDSTVFTYLLPSFPINLTTPGIASSGFITIEADTVSGASPYIFNISLRSVYGMNGMLADGSKASGFRSMVMAQFTAISLQKDDRAFVKYNKTSRNYQDNLPISRVAGASLSSGSSSLGTVYHQDSGSIYRSGWETSHIKATNDSILQVVSVFAIGFNKHFDAESGGDMSITNSNSNFGQLSLNSTGFKKKAFEKDNKAFITSIITPRAIIDQEENIDWIQLDVAKTISAANNTRLYLFGFTDEDNIPPTLTQGYRIGAKALDKLYFVNPNTNIEYAANILMSDGVTSSVKEYVVTAGPSSNIFTLGTHNLNTGEKVIILSDDGDLPENIVGNTVYFAIKHSNTEIKLASSLTAATSGDAITVFGGTNLRILSRVSDKVAGDIGHPVQYDGTQWYITTNIGSDIYGAITSLGTAVLTEKTEPSYVKRISDSRSLDEKIYKIRVVIPKETVNGKNPESSFIIQQSSSTGITTGLSVITTSNYGDNKNPSLIAKCTRTNTTVTIISELPHNLQVGDGIIVKNITDSTYTTAVSDRGSNGTFVVASVVDDMTFTYTTPDSYGSNLVFTNDTTNRSIASPRFERNNLQSNLYIYRNEVISEYIGGIQDGVYHFYVLSADKAIPTEFTNIKYSQNPVDLYPQLDRDNINDNPTSAKSFAKRSPLGEVVTNDLKKSITKESTDTLLASFGVGLDVSGVSNETTTTPTITFAKRHGLAGIVTYSSLVGGATYVNGTYQNVRLLNTSQTGSWKGATAKVVVGGGVITSAEIVSSGSGYSTGELFFDASVVGNGDGAARFNIVTSGISAAIGNVVQFTGAGTTSDTYHRITGIATDNTIGIARTVGDPVITTNQYAFVVGPSIQITSTTSSSGITTFTCSSPHGLFTGNKFRVIDSSNNNKGDYLVKDRVGVNTFTATTPNISVAGGYILKHGLSANNASSDSSGENLGTRSITLYDEEILVVGAAVTSGATTIPVSSLVGVAAITSRFPLGSYIQIDEEIMRVSTGTLTGTGNNELSVIRGSLATRQVAHDNGSLIKKIKPIPIELRRPSILRASGHTFEYLGYGPGNYSTGLPQVQTITLTEREEFLVQSQERSAGVVVYTGMNNRGDSFVGNRKTSSATGEEVTFDNPVPTVTGEDPSRLSVVFDEVIIKERLVVEGGNSRTVLSQFDGPVTFNKEVKFSDLVNIKGKLKVSNTEQSTSTTTGALIVSGGVGIAKNLSVGGLLNIAGVTTISDTTQSTSKDNGCLVLEGGLGVEKNANIGGTLAVTGATTLGGLLNANGGIAVDTSAFTVADTTGNTVIGGTLGVTGATTLSSTLGVTGATTLSSTLGVTGATTLSSTLGVTGATTLSSTLGVTGATTLSSTLGVTGATTLSSTLGVTGATTLTGLLTVNNNITAGANTITAANFTGQASASSTIRTVSTSTNASHFITFVNSNNGTAANESLFTDAGLFYNPSTNALSVTGDIIAFASDERLKENIQPLENALDKVLALSGFTYTFNEIGESLGFDTTITYVGVSAQQVQAVLPEAVKPAPANEDYLTVQYEKIVPLLIEAIKELKAEIDELKKINN